jgi:hypothetical protein
MSTIYFARLALFLKSNLLAITFFIYCERGIYKSIFFTALSLKIGNRGGWDNLCGVYFQII